MRPSGANTRSRLLCPDCHEVKRVSKITDGVILLACGHSRSELLPLQPGHISLEHVRAEKGQQLFPIIRGGITSMLTRTDF
jgi:hypothetical protein